MLIFNCFSFIIFLILTLLGIGESLFILGIIQLTALIVYAVRNVDRSKPLLFFLISFFTYYQSSELLFFVFPNLLDIFGIQSKIDYNTQIIKFSSIYLGLFFISLGFSLVKDRFKVYDRLSLSQIERSHIFYRMRKYLIWIFYLTSVFSLFKILTIGPSILQGNYAKGSGPSVSQITNLLTFLNSFTYISYLCCFPTKKEIKRTLPLFLIISIGSLAFGSRGNAVCIVLYLILYFLSRDYYRNKDDRFINKKTKWILFTSLPFILAGLSLFAFVRSGQDLQSNGILLDSLSFFEQQGGTGNLITLADKYEASLPSGNISYTFGPVISLFQKFFGNTNPLGMDSMVYEATMGNNLGATLTYLTQPEYYFSGGGLGSSYLAELFVDFGYLGIIVYNFLLGILLRYISFDVRKNLMARIICSFILLSIFFLPRDFALSITKIFTPAYICSFAGISILHTICERENQIFGFHIKKDLKTFNES